jgi:hypothetical protein
MQQGMHWICDLTGTLAGRKYGQSKMPKTEYPAGRKNDQWKKAKKTNIRPYLWLNTLVGTSP